MLDPRFRGEDLFSVSLNDREIQVVVPVDGMSAKNTYAEQVTAWQLTNAPAISNRATLTKFDQIRV